MTPSQLLRKAAHLIETKGWCRNTYRDLLGRHCALGALMTYADLTEPTCDKALKLLQEAIGDFGPVGWWNDAKGRTAQEVIATLIKAAEIGEPEKRRVLIPQELPVAPMTPDSPLWTDPAPEEPKKVPERVPA